MCIRALVWAIPQLEFKEALYPNVPFAPTTAKVTILKFWMAMPPQISNCF